MALESTSAATREPGDGGRAGFAVAGALSGLLAVAAGAFGAHALRSRLVPEMLQVFETAARYQMYHALALLIVVAVAGDPLSTPGRWAARLFLAGTVLFSGSLYALSLTGLSALGIITPFGGAAFLGGWICLALAVHRRC